MELCEVKDSKSEKEFLEVARVIYKNDTNWVCPLDQDISNIFNPDKNNFYKHGEAIRWILKSKTGQLLGRIGAFVDFNSGNDSDQPTGGCGFFECINDQPASAILFDAAKARLAALRFRRASRSPDRHRHVGVLGVREDKILAANGIGMNSGELLI